MKLSLSIGNFLLRQGLRLSGKSASSLTQAFVRGDDVGEATGTTLLNAYQQSTWIYSCISTTAQQLAQINFKLCRQTRNGEELIEAGPLFDLFAKPHPHLNKFEFWELVVTWLLLRGNCFVIVLDRGGAVLRLDQLARGSGRPARLLVLNADRMTPVISDHQLAFWRYSGSTTDAYPTMEFAPEEVIQMKLPNPFDFWWGMSPLGVARLAADTDYAAAQTMRGLMRNNASPGRVFTTDQQLTPEQQEQIQAGLQRARRRAGNVNNDVFLFGGAKLEKPDLTMVDLQFLENRKYSRQEICAIFKTPQEVLGYTEDANRSVGEMARLNWIENCIVPMGDRLGAAFQSVAQSAGSEVRGYFDYSELPVMKAAQRARIDSAVKLWAMGVPLADLNTTLELGLPEQPWHKAAYLPFSVTPVNAAGDGGPDEPVDIEEVDDDEQLGAAFTKLLSSGVKLLGTGDSKEGKTRGMVHVCAPSPDWERATLGAIRLAQSKVSRFFFEQRSIVLARLDGILKTEEQKSVKAFEELEALIAAENAKLLRAMEQLAKVNLTFGGQQIYAEIAASDIFSLPPEKAIQFLNTRENKIKDINATTFETLTGQIQDGLAAGESYAQIADRVRDVYADAGQIRAETIAVTEVNTAINAGRMEGMKAAKVELKGWAISTLANVRSSHRQAARDYADGIPLDQKFRVGGFWLSYPGDTNGPAEEVINCRCFTFAIATTKGVPAAILSFDDWAKTPAGISLLGKPPQAKE